MRMSLQYKCEMLEEMTAEVRLGVYYLAGYGEEVDELERCGLVDVVRPARPGDEDHVRITDKGRKLLNRWSA